MIFIYNRQIFYCITLGIFFSMPYLAFCQFGGGLSVELGAGATQLYGEMMHKPLKFGYHIGADYIVIPFMTVGVQGMMGRLAANDPMGRMAKNNYMGANINAKARLGLLWIDDKENFELTYIREHFFRSLIRNIYVGTGIGLLRNEIDANRGTPNDAHLVGEDESSAVFVPLNLGIDIPFGYSISGPTWAINANAQLGLYFGDELDGYANMYSRHDDRLLYLSLSIKKSFLNRATR